MVLSVVYVQPVHGYFLSSYCTQTFITFDGEILNTTDNFHLPVITFENIEFRSIRTQHDKLIKCPCRLIRRDTRYFQSCLSAKKPDRLIPISRVGSKARSFPSSWQYAPSAAYVAPKSLASTLICEIRSRASLQLRC